MTDPKALTAGKLPKMHGYLMHRLLDLPERQRRTLVPEIEDYANACVSAALATREQTASTGPVAWKIDWPEEQDEEPSYTENPNIAAVARKMGREVTPLYAAPVEQAGSAPDETLREALAELVACKDLKARAEAIPKDGLFASQEEADRCNAMRADYKRRQPLAWEAARRALATKP